MTPATLARLSRKGVFLTPTDEPVQPLSMIFSGQGAFSRGWAATSHAPTP